MYFQSIRTKGSILKHGNVILPCLTGKRANCVFCFVFVFVCGNCVCRSGIYVGCYEVCVMFVCGEFMCVVYGR